MPISIAQSQANAGTNFLDSIGTERGEIQPVNLSATARVMVTTAGRFVKDAQHNLIKANRISSGELSKSIKAGNIEVKGETLELAIYAKPYYEYIDKGAKYTSKGPPIDVIEKWIKKEKGKHTLKAKPKLKREKARAKLNQQQNDRGLAIYISGQIKKNGLKPTHFWSKALDKLKIALPEQIKISVVTDIKNSL